MKKANWHCGMANQFAFMQGVFCLEYPPKVVCAGTRCVPEQRCEIFDRTHGIACIGDITGRPE